MSHLFKFVFCYLYLVFNLFYRFISILFSKNLVTILKKVLGFLLLSFLLNFLFEIVKQMATSITKNGFHVIHFHVSNGFNYLENT